MLAAKEQTAIMSVEIGIVTDAQNGAQQHKLAQEVAIVHSPTTNA